MDSDISVLVSCHVVRKSGSQRDIPVNLHGMECGGSSSDSSWHVTFGTTILSSRVVVTLE